MPVLLEQLQHPGFYSWQKVQNGFGKISLPSCRQCYGKPLGFAFCFRKQIHFVKFLCLSWKTLSWETCRLKLTPGSRFLHPHACMRTRVRADTHTRAHTHVCVFIYGSSKFWRAWGYVQSMSISRLGEERCSEGGAEGTRHLGATESTHRLLPAMARGPGCLLARFSFTKAEATSFTFDLPFYSPNPNSASPWSPMRVTGRRRKRPPVSYTLSDPHRRRREAGAGRGGPGWGSPTPAQPLPAPALPPPASPFSQCPCAVGRAGHAHWARTAPRLPHMLTGRGKRAPWEVRSRSGRRRSRAFVP